MKTTNKFKNKLSIEIALSFMVACPLAVALPICLTSCSKKLPKIIFDDKPTTDNPNGVLYFQAAHPIDGFHIHADSTNPKLPDTLVKTQMWPLFFGIYLWTNFDDNTQFGSFYGSPQELKTWNQLKLDWIKWEPLNEKWVKGKWGNGGYLALDNVATLTLDFENHPSIEYSLSWHFYSLPV